MRSRSWAFPPPCSIAHSGQGRSAKKRSQAARDQELHDLVGARVYTHHPRVPIHARNRKFLHVAVTAEQLEAAVDDLPLQIGDPVFGHGGGDGVELPLEIALDAVVVEDTRDRRLGFALREHELRVLEFDDLLAESLPLLDVVDRQRERALEHGLGMDDDEEPLPRQIVHQLREALPLFASQQVLGREFQVLEKELRGIGGIEPELGELAATAKAGRIVGLHHHQRDAFGSGRGVCLGDDDDQVRVLAVGDERF